MYLYHQPVILALAGIGVTAAVVPPLAGSRWPGALVFIIISGAVTLAVALVSWHVCEKHFQRLKDRFAYRGP
jgi:peptidoglycan/LPS O-acetylase OafA/YrhL